MTSLHLAEQPILTTSAGTTATVELDTIVVRDDRGRPLLSFGEEGVRLMAAEGDLIISAPNGRVVIDAGTDIDVSGGGRVTVRSAEADLHAEHVNLVAEQLVSCCTAVAYRVGRWDLQAKRIAVRAGEIYRDVDGLVQTRAGRLRQIIDGASQLIAKRASITCDEDVSLDGNRVLLG